MISHLCTAGFRSQN